VKSLEEQKKNNQLKLGRFKAAKYFNKRPEDQLLNGDEK